VAKTPNPNDVLKLGQDVATLKANMPAKRWAQFVKSAHARGFTVGGAARGGPDALKERTTSSLKAQAAKSVADAYAPAAKALDTRQAAIGYLDEKRKNDDAAYRTWLSGEVGKLNAQAQAADATLAAQQTGIATETQNAIAAARADSLARMGATPGNVSDPSQSTALANVSNADEASTKHIAAAREQSAALTKIGGDSRALAGASLLAQQGARESTRQGDTLKALGDVNTDRTKMLSDQALATLTKSDSLIDKNTSIVQANREADLAGASLGLKQDSLAASVADSNRKYSLAKAKFGLDKWKADHADTVAQAKLKLGYDQIASREGVAAAKRQLDKELTKIRAKDKAKSKGVTTAERTVYNDIQTARSLFERWDKNNAVSLTQRDFEAQRLGIPTAAVEIGHELARNGGKVTNALRAKMRKAGLVHSAYFYSLAAGEAGGPAGPPKPKA
jgi:hypothetical protein